MTRAALAAHANTDPALGASWLAEVQADRLAAGAQLEALASGGPSAPRSLDDVRQLVESLGDVPRALSGADPTDKARLYATLGLAITYDATKRCIVVEGRPDERCALARVGGGT